MHVGVHLFPTKSSVQPDDLARVAEDRGLESVWFSEHTHIPVRFLNAPGRPAPLAAHLWQTYDLFVAMTLAVAATTTIKVGTGVALILERDPIIFAKQTATLDRVSHGRFLCGVGAGWIEPEMADHGVVFRTRYQQLKEHIQALKAIWMTEESAFHGTFVNFDPMRAFPKPYQRPHPPIIMGGGGKKAIELAAELCTGWAPWGMDWPTARAAIADLKRQAAARGRDPHALEISLFEESIPDDTTLADMEAAGVTRIIVTIYAQSREAALPILDRVADLHR